VTAITPQIIADVLLLLATLGVAGLSRNGYVRRKLNLSLLLTAASLAVIAAMYVPAFSKALEDFRDVPGLLFAAALINALVVTLLNPFRTDRISDRFPNIVQDAVIVGLFFGITTLIFKETILTASAISAVVVGFALQDTLGNAFAGLGIQVEKPFRVGHWIKVGDFEGKVSQITWRATKIATRAGTYVILPNNVISKESITNYSEPILPVRITVEVGATYLKPPNVVKAVILEAIGQAPLVLKTPAPDVLLTTFGDSAITYLARFWVPAFEIDEEAKDQVRSGIYYSFRRHGIDIPWPIQVQYEAHTMPSAALTTTDDVAALMGTVEIFGALGEQGRQSLVAGSHETLFAAGETIVRQGEPGASMFVIHSGEVRVTIEPGGHEVARLGPGSFFGEMSLLTGDPRTANVAAVSDTLAIEISADNFRRIALAQPAVVDAVGLAVVTRRAGLDKTRTEAAARAASLTDQSNTLVSRIKRFLRLPAA
jgi:small-conductance mechanosensitive channel/CRP-like cAMP-binding protein